MSKLNKKYRELTIDFDATEQRIREVAASDSDKIAQKIRGELLEGVSAEAVLSHVPGYTKDKIVTAARTSLMPIQVFIEKLAEMPPEMIRPILAKEPSRTVFQEKLQFDVLSKQSEIVFDLVNLPNGGKNSRHLSGAKKSIDFIGKALDSNGNIVEIIIAAKYTKNDGGSQDNQRNDVLEFAYNAPDKKDETNKNIVVLLTDGEYYEKKRDIYNGNNFHEFVNKTFIDKRVIACSTKNFDKCLAEVLS